MTLTIPDGDEVYSGRIDGLIIAQQLWLVLVESKRPRFSASTGVPQALAYACANPNRDRPLFLMVTNGDDFIFLKVEGDRYSRPVSFSIFGQGSAGFEGVLRVLRRIKAITLPTSD
ncbi:MAG: type I restriction endonuclease [Cyanophyceae cyanobacterium]